jgi:hypothetical protein
MSECNLAAAVNALVAAVHDRHGIRPVRVALELANGKQLVLPLPDEKTTVAETGHAEPPHWAPLHEAILAALAGKALRSHELTTATCCDRTRLFHPDALPELLDRGLIAHHPKLGFYRPDAPPPELL